MSLLTRFTYTVIENTLNFTEYVFATQKMVIPHVRS